jgi:hypothetical protein
VTILAGQYHSARLAFLTWLERYLARENIRDRKLWASLQGELRPYRRPEVHRVLRHMVKLADEVSLFGRIARRALPVPVYSWLRNQKNRFGETVAERAGLFQPNPRP